MFTIVIADLPIELDNRYAYVRQLCDDYLAEDTLPLFRVKATSEEIEAYRVSICRPMTLPEAEAHLLYRKICERLPAYDAFLLHAVLVSMDGRGYAFSAERGVGKSTHAALWKDRFGSRVTILNGDKPIIRRLPDGHLWAYGTPFAGKEGIHANARTPLSAICFLEQGRENRMSPTPTADAVSRMLMSTVMPCEPALQERMATLVGYTVRQTPTYTLACRPEAAAAELAFEVLSRL